MVVKTVWRSTVELTAWVTSPSACSSPTDWASSRVRACLVEQPHVLDRDHRLVGERFDQFDLLARERLDCLALQDNDSNRASFAQQGHSQKCASAADPCRLLQNEFRVSENISDLDDAPLLQSTAGDRSAPDRDRLHLHKRPILRRKAPMRHLPEHFAMLAGNADHVSLAQPSR
jgi:hypothetical protein